MAQEYGSGLRNKKAPGGESEGKLLANQINSIYEIGFVD